MLVDKMVYAMSNSNTTTAQLSEAYKNCAVTAMQLGYDLDDTTATLMVMADGESGGETEAGMTQRDVVWLGVRSIAVKFSVTTKWLKLLTGFKQQEKIAVDYFDTETLEIVSTEMYIDGYKAVRKADTSYRGLWEVCFTLKEF